MAIDVVFRAVGSCHHIFFLGMHDFILTKVFGNIEQEVMKNARIYLLITSISIVPLAIYNAGAALFRSMGNSKVTMVVSAIMNVINITGNAIMIFGLHMGVAGAAIPTVVSRITAAVIIFCLLFQKKREIHFNGQVCFRFHKDMIKKILYIGVPNGLENSLFQLGKILLLSLISSFGTVAIAANAIANTITMFNIIPGMAIGFAQLSTVAVCVGAGDEKQARFYTKKLVKITYLGMTALSALVLLFGKYILKIYHLTPETEALTLTVISFHAIMVLVAWIPSFSIPNTFRAAGDVVVPMVTAIFSMWFFRIGAAYILSSYFKMGLMGVWIAMTIDWSFRAIVYTIRYVKGGWTKRMQR